MAQMTMIRTMSVKISGSLLYLFSRHIVLNSLDRWPLAIIPLRNGVAHSSVMMPLVPCAQSGGSIFCRSGWRNCVVSVMSMMVRMVNMVICLIIAWMSLFQLRLCPVMSVPGVYRSSVCVQVVGSILQSVLYAGVAALSMYGVVNVVITETATTMG